MGGAAVAIAGRQVIDDPHGPPFLMGRHRERSLCGRVAVARVQVQGEEDGVERVAQLVCYWQRRGCGLCGITKQLTDLPVELVGWKRQPASPARSGPALHASGRRECGRGRRVPGTARQTLRRRLRELEMNVTHHLEPAGEDQA